MTLAPNTTAAAQSAVSHRYNDDLLIDQESRAHAAREFASVFHLLDHPELRAAFEREDGAASRAKLVSRGAGFWTVVYALLSLMAASSEPAWDPSGYPAKWIGAISALLALAAAFIAVWGLLWGARKSAWLHRRLYTERLRQFHFQTFIWRLDEIARSLSGPEGPDGYRRQRDLWFAGFENRYARKRDDKLVSVLDPTVAPRVWLHDSGEDRPPRVPKGVDLSEVFRAYRALRFEEQVGYADHLLRWANAPGRPDRKTSWKDRIWFPLGSFPIRVQLTLLRCIWVAAFAVLIVTHVFIVVRSFTGAGDHIAWLSIGVMWLALVAIAANTMSEGLAISRELERCQEYRAVVGDLLARFDPAGNPQDCVAQMMEMERASFEEMRSFLRTHKEAAFAM